MGATKLTRSLTRAFVLCVFEFVSLSWFSAVPLCENLDLYYSANYTTVPGGCLENGHRNVSIWFCNAEASGYPFTPEGWNLAFMYAALCAVIVLACGLAAARGRRRVLTRLQMRPCSGRSSATGCSAAAASMRVGRGAGTRPT